MPSSFRLYSAAAGLVLLLGLGGCSAPISSPVSPMPASPNPVTKESPGIKAAISALERDDPAAAVLIAAPLAASGDAGAQHLLGFLHDLGLGVPFDRKLGLEWQERAAGTGHYWANLYLGWKYRVGLGPEKPDPAKGDELQSVIFKHTPPPRVIPAEWLLVNGSSFAPNYVRARRWLAAQGDAAAAATLAEYFLAGLGVRADVQQHLRWLAIAAERGHAASLERLSLYYDKGIGVAANPALALDFLQRAAAAGSAAAQYSLGRKLLAGRELPAAEGKAAEWLRKAAAQNHIAATNRLADLLRKGAPGVPVDFEEALRLSRQAAALGDPEAIADVAGMLRKGQGAAKDLSEAFRLYQNAAEKGYARAAHMAGWMLANGEAGDKDYAEARRWFEIAAKSDYAPAMREVGALHWKGLGTPASESAAFVWFERAAREGDDWAQDRVGWMLLKGTGIEKDAEEAVGWFKLAAKQNYGPALFHLGYCHLQGTGTEKNLVLAADCLRQALAAGEKQAITYLASVALMSTGEAQVSLLREVTPLLTKEDFAADAPGDKARQIRAMVLLHDKNPLKNETAGVAALEKTDVRDSAAVVALVRHYCKTGAGAKARAQLEAVPAPKPAIINYYLGLIYLTGTGGPRDPAAGFSALKHGPKESALPMAYCYYHGLGVASNLPAALSLVRQAAEFGDAAARAALEKPTEQETLNSLFSFDPQSTQHLSVVVDESKPVVSPQLIESCVSVYPFLLKLLGIDGRATVEFIVDKSGAPTDIQVIECSAPDFGMAAATTIAWWRFTPGKKDGEPVKTRLSQTLEFNLGN